MTESLIGFKTLTRVTFLFYYQQLQKSGAEFRGFTTEMTLMCSLKTKDVNKKGGQTHNSVHRTRLDMRAQ